MKSSTPSFRAALAFTAIGALSTGALADKNPNGDLFDASGGLPAPPAKSYSHPAKYDGKKLGTPADTSGGGIYGAYTPSNSSPWSNSNPGGSLIIPSGTVMQFPASASYVWNASTHPLPLNPAAPKNLELGTWTIKDKSKNTIVGTWTWIAANQNFSGSYTNGVIDTLRVDEFTATKITFSGYNSYGLAVDFTGRRTSPNTAEGIATAHSSSGASSWLFSASW